MQNILNSVFLVQTDTTIGFLSKNMESINKKKGAKLKKPLLLEVAELKHIPYRTPIYFHNIIRRATKTSFILQNNMSFRVIKHDLHKQFLIPFKHLYSSSANKTGCSFEFNFAIKQCDILVYDKRGFFEAKSSKILKIKHNKIKKLR